ncbi:TetR/AcrR family transcriptional regulator [Mycobacterium sp. ACS4331]|uniref:TetR/AcrR family transcriptional regulator n=1 Tax=Mycobacterium sp. ACS4331 TaxID=1834121 RepID=UPI0007FE1BEB|nr:TetR/AcrR family transcriptional regulator [Mycobacterium sp. ACS4331]OBF12494.1 TetR family transcriptional regulator [Mycobacterium sp. ACS4331]
MSEARGRPRDPQTDRDILAATRRLLTDVGYEQVSIEAIARAAGVSRPTVYRRWPSKAHVMFDAVFEDPPDDEMPSTSGDFEADLLTFVRGALIFWRQPAVEAAALGILAERHRDPQLHIRTQQLLDERTRAAFSEVVRAGVEQGEVDPGVDADMLYQVVIGTAFYTAQMGGDTTDIDGFAKRLCALVTHGARPNTTGRAQKR